MNYALNCQSYGEGPRMGTMTDTRARASGPYAAFAVFLPFFVRFVVESFELRNESERSQVTGG